MLSLVIFIRLSYFEARRGGRAVSHGARTGVHRRITSFIRRSPGARGGNDADAKPFATAAIHGRHPPYSEASKH